MCESPAEPGSSYTTKTGCHWYLPGYFAAVPCWRDWCFTGGHYWTVTRCKFHMLRSLHVQFSCHEALGKKFICQSLHSHRRLISIVKPTRCTNVSNLFYFGMTLDMFRMVFPSIIRSSGRLYIQQRAFVQQLLLLLASGYPRVPELQKRIYLINPPCKIQ